MGAQDQGGEKTYRDLKFPRRVGLWGEILSINMKQRFGMCLNRVPFFENYKEEATVSGKLCIQRVEECTGEESRTH